MKNKTIYLTLGVVTCLMSCIYAESYVFDEDVVKKDRPVEAFTSIRVSHGWDLFLTQGNGHAMVVEASEAIHKRLNVEVKNGVLIIDMDNAFSINGTKRIYLTFENLEKIDASGGSDIKADTEISSELLTLNLSGGSDADFMSLNLGDLNGSLSGGSDLKAFFVSVNNIDIEASGGSDIKFDGVNSKHCHLELSGGSDARINGKSDGITVSASGGSDIIADNFQVLSAEVDLSGASDAKLFVHEKLVVNFSGGSDIACKGNPEVVNKSNCKSCSIKLL